MPKLPSNIILLVMLVVGCNSENRGTPPFIAAPQRAEWERAAFAVVQTELSPATLFHCEGKEINLFTHLADYGLGGPTHVACATRAGIKSYNVGEVIDASWLEECWLLVWFAGAKGWTNWDIPWAIYLQRKPTVVRLNQNGLRLRFPISAGDIVLLPLYGYDKPQSVAPSPRPSPPVGEREKTAPPSPRPFPPVEERE